ncbi:hypothetical protein HB777_39570 (plasmid) [Mesorhizobium loti]|nr:hypothetical protein HB777_39570 [Mesorhizobium loti]
MGRHSWERPFPLVCSGSAKQAQLDEDTETLTMNPAPMEGNSNGARERHCGECENATCALPRDVAQLWQTEPLAVFQFWNFARHTR